MPRIQTYETVKCAEALRTFLATRKPGEWACYYEGVALENAAPKEAEMAAMARRLVQRGGAHCVQLRVSPTTRVYLASPGEHRGVDEAWGAKP